MRFVMLRLLICGLLVVLVSCGNEERRIPVLSARQNADDELRVEVGACDDEAVVVTVEETAEEVRFTARSDEEETDDDCGAASLRITLKDPLAGRRLVDASSNEVVPVEE